VQYVHDHEHPRVLDVRRGGHHTPVPGAVADEPILRPQPRKGWRHAGDGEITEKERLSPRVTLVEGAVEHPRRSVAQGLERIRLGVLGSLGV